MSISAILTIQSQTKPYTVERGSSFESALKDYGDNRTDVWLVDRVFIDGPLKVDSLVSRLNIVAVSANEEAKSFQSLYSIIIELIEKGLKRNGRLIVLGGGVVQDIGCFIASILYRGVKWEYIPTTLLSQSDSCIGSKSSINIGSFKNQLGTFYPPTKVLLFNSLLSSLPYDELRSGMGEILKLQYIAGEEPFNELLREIKKVGLNGCDLLKWVDLSLVVKKKYIEIDEYDLGIRNILNYGHTFGHAYETCTFYEIPHGIAVVLGMLTAMYVSMRMGLMADATYRSIKLDLFEMYHPYEKLITAIAPTKLLEAIRKDKKAESNSIKCILTKGPGYMDRIDVPIDQILKPIVEEFLSKDII
jgi:3-dehydroquinate synthase